MKILAVLTLVSILLGSASMVADAATDKPNVIFILSDNQSAQALPLYGNHDLRTPNIDSLAEDGVVFNRAFAANGMCSATRATLMTGLMPSQHGVHDALVDYEVKSMTKGWSSIGEFRTLPLTLQEKGYRTAMVGKWHLGQPDTPETGFEHWLTFPYGHTEHYWDSEVLENGEIYEVKDRHMVDFLTDKAVEYVNAQDGGKPFYLQLNYNGPYALPPSNWGAARNRFFKEYLGKNYHSRPTDAPDPVLLKRLGMSEQEVYTEAEAYLQSQSSEASSVWGGKVSSWLGSLNIGVINDFMMHLFGQQGLFAFMHMQQDSDSYANFLSQGTMVDDGVGRLIGALKEKGLYDNTVIVYSSDQGNLYGQHGTWGHTITWSLGHDDFDPPRLYETAMHIPLIVKDAIQDKPVGGKGIVSEAMIGQYDIMPTLLELVGADDVTVANSPGRSFAGVVRGDDSEHHQAVFFEESESRGVRTADYAYWKRMDGTGEPALYDMINDPGQYHNLVDRAEYEKVVQQLDAELTAFFSETVNPRYDLWNGGVTKGTSMRRAFWQRVYGSDWESDRESKPAFKGDVE